MLLIGQHEQRRQLAEKGGAAFLDMGFTPAHIRPTMTPFGARQR